jgi:hypothetical protein
MTVVKINAFGGMVPATDDRLLPDQAAAETDNVWLYSGDLIGIVTPTHVRDLVGADTSKVYRIPNNYYDQAHIDDATFMEFDHIDTDVLRSPIVGDTFERYYWVSPQTSPRINSVARIRAGNDEYLLGVPQPGTPSLIVTGGVGATVTRAYAVTWVTAFDEEGPPSSPVTVSDNTDGSWDLTMVAATVDQIADHNLDKVRIYRTVTSGSDTTYFFVAEQDIADTTYSDTATDAVVSLNEELQSTTLVAPPSDLIGLTSLPNGMIAGFREGELWFCEPYRPHAWPAAYAIAVEYPIIGLGVQNQSLVVLTAGYPMIATGIHPSAITLSKLAAFEPCASRGSILSAPEGVYYSSPNGLVLVANGRATNVTKDLIQKDRWNTLVGVNVLRAANLGTAYFAYGSQRLGFMQEDFVQDDPDPVLAQVDDFAFAYNGVTVETTNQRVAFNLLSCDTTTPTVNVFNDPWSGAVLIIRDGKLYELNVSDEQTVREPYLWRSKIFQGNTEQNFAALKVFFSVPSWIGELPAERNTDEEQTLADDQYGLVRVYADDRLVMTRELRESGELMRIPSGFTADFWQIEFEGRVRIQSVQMATSVKELKRV